MFTVSQEEGNWQTIVIEESLCLVCWVRQEYWIWKKLCSSWNWGRFNDVMMSQKAIITDLDPYRNVITVPQYKVCAKFHACRLMHNPFSVSPCSVLSSVHNGLTSMPLQMTIGFRALKNWKHCILIYLFAKFHACRPICTILSLFHVQYCPLVILTNMPLKMTIGFSALTKWNHYILIYICAKFHACKPICTILSVLCSMLSIVNNGLTGMPLQMTIGFITSKKGMTIS